MLFSILYKNIIINKNKTKKPPIISAERTNFWRTMRTLCMIKGCLVLRAALMGIISCGITGRILLPPGLYICIYVCIFSVIKDEVIKNKSVYDYAKSIY
jgi:hypothetical protein